ncbi:probable ATP-dependent RNA helicase DDX58 [Anneissia japonica]|uniref:probable ATP-dependent RNA helicase DDX58 n=1 Tax=Anneissia japonica TaxID=1529436 RepID=UPI001425AD56|nr:probable ATP-dependent RNA helicase DDX58 [Anneissia japonica]
MAEDDAYVAAFKKYREEFSKCVNVTDIILALGNTLTNNDEGRIKAVSKSEGNSPAALCLCECLFRRPNWKENIVKALRSDEIKQDDLANRIEKEFRAIDSESANSSHGSVPKSNVQIQIPVQLPQTTQGIPSMVISQIVNVYNDGARSKVIISTTSDSAGSRRANNFHDVAPAVPEKDMNNIPLKKYEEQLVADALDGKQKNVLIIIPNEDETRSRIPAHICTTHLQNPGVDGVKKPKAICLTTINRINWFGSLQKYVPRTIRIKSILDDQKDITAESMKNIDVILSTPEIFERALNSKALAFKEITLLILDDCHLSCQIRHPYRSIMKSYLEEKLTSNSAMTKVVGLATRGNLQNQGDVKKAADNLRNLMGTLDATCIFAVTKESTRKEFYKQSFPKISQFSVVERRQDNTFCSVISEMMSKIEQKLDMSAGPSQRHSEEYGFHIAELSKQEEEKQGKKIKSERSVLLKHLAIYNEVLQMNEIMRTKDAFALLKIFYREHNDDEWLDDLYQEHLSELYKLSKEGDGKYENPRLAHLKREILAKSGGDFNAIIVSEHRQVREALYNWLKCPDFKNLTIKSLGIADKSSDIEIFNAEQRLLLLSSTELKDAKLTGVKMAVIFGIKDGIHIFQSEDDVTDELLDLVADLQFNEVVKSLQILPESVKQESNLNKKLQILRESGEVKEQNISKVENVRVDGLKAVKWVTDKSYLFDTTVRGQTSEGVTSSTASSAYIKSKLFTEKEKGSSVNASGKAIEKESTKHIPSMSSKVDMNASSHGQKVENQSELSKFKLYCRGGIGHRKCVFVCSLSEIRLISRTNHVYNDFYWNWSKIEVREHHDEEKRKCGTKKIYCKECGADWGNTCKGYPCFKLKSFIVRLPNGKWMCFSERKSFGVSIPPMSNEDQ